VVIKHPLSASSIFYDPRHPCSIYMPDSLFSQSLQVFFHLPFGLVPSTSYSIHLFSLSLSSFRSTCPYHCNLFCCSTEIMSSNLGTCEASRFDSNSNRPPDSIRFESDGPIRKFSNRIGRACPLLVVREEATENAGLENARPENAGQNVFYFLPLSCAYCTGI